LKNIDADQLPVHWGGTARDPDGDPYCKSKIGRGGPIPEKYRLNKVKLENNNINNFSSITIDRGSSTPLQYDVEQVGSVLSWNFFTEDKDVGFGVYRRTGDAKQLVKDMEEVLPNERVNCHMVPESGTWICETPGTYIVQFDNSYSWLNAKKVSYLISVIVPDAGKDLQYIDSTDF